MVGTNEYRRFMRDCTLWKAFLERSQNELSQAEKHQKSLLCADGCKGIWQRWRFLKQCRKKIVDAKRLIDVIGKTITQYQLIWWIMAIDNHDAAIVALGLLTNYLQSNSALFDGRCSDELCVGIIPGKIADCMAVFKKHKKDGFS